MASRRRERKGGGQTTPRSTDSKRPSKKPLLLRPFLDARPRERDQKPRTAPFAGHGCTRVQELSRAKTASARHHISRRIVGGRARLSEDLFLPRAETNLVAYEGDEGSSFYAGSTSCKLGRLFSDGCLIQPNWSKTTTSPWGNATRACGGYGQRLMNGANSVDTPEFMYSKIVRYAYEWVGICRKSFEGFERNLNWKKRPRPFAYQGEANTAVSDDTPGFFRRQHTQVHGKPIEKIDKPRLIKILLDRQVLGELAVPETDERRPLEWD